MNVNDEIIFHLGASAGHGTEAGRISDVINIMASDACLQLCPAPRDCVRDRT